MAAPPPTMEEAVDRRLSAGEEEAQEQQMAAAAAAAADEAPAKAAAGDDAGGTAKEHAIYAVSLQFNKALSLAGGLFTQGGRPWWTPIPIPRTRAQEEEGTSSAADGSLVLVLGALPLRDEAHLETLTQATVASNGFNRVTAVLTLNKPFELEPSMIATPVSPNDWKAAKVTQMHMQVQDFQKPSPQQFDECCAFLDEQLKPDSTVYVHCKAGRGRSCAVVCCYLVHRGMTAHDAMEYVKHHRPHVSMGSSQAESVNGFEEYRRARDRTGGAVAQPHTTQPDGAEDDDTAAATAVASSSKLPPDHHNTGKQQEPSCECLKQKPTLRTWPTRFVQIRDMSLLVYDSKETFLHNPSVLRHDGDRMTSTDNVRNSTVKDLTGCTVTSGEEKFTFGGTYYKMTLRNDDWEHPVGPETSFCFQARYDRDRFVAAVTNIAAGRAWDDLQGAPSTSHEPEPEPEPEPVAASLE
jgi:atypical dual specificity phosphatase